MRGIIYGYYQQLSNKWYVGMTIDEITRKSGHRSGKRTGVIFKKALDKYGYNSFDYVILEEVFDEDKVKLMEILREREKYYIKEKDSFKNGYNATEGGEGCAGYKHTIEHRNYISKVLTGRKMSPERIEQMQQFNLGNKNWLGKTHTEESKKKMSDNKRGKKMEFSDEHRKFLSESLRERRSVKVEQYSLDGLYIATYDSITVATKTARVDRESIYRSCEGLVKNPKKYIWKYASITNNNNL